MGLEKCEGDCQIESGSQFFLVGRVQVDGGAPWREFKPACRESNEGSIGCLAYRGTRKAQKLSARQTAGEFHLDLHRTRRHPGQQ